MLVYYNILFPFYIESCLTYSAFSKDSFGVGDYVIAELGHKKKIGVIWSKREGFEASTVKYPIKPLLERLDIAPMNSKLRDFIDWTSDYTMTKAGMILRQSISPTSFFRKEKPISYYSLGEKLPERMTKARSEIIETLKENKNISRENLVKNFSIRVSILHKMVEQGYVKRKLAFATRSILQKKSKISFLNKDDLQDCTLSKSVLSPQQQKAADICLSALSPSVFRTFFLNGVTGSGKTEVYLQVIRHCQNLGRQILVLVPEISLTPQLIERFNNRLNITPTPFHSRLSPKKRWQYWQAVNNNQTPIIIGARSALFLPFANLGLIIVDEEHDSGYKQEEGFIHNARDMAVKLAEMNEIPIILASATASIETYYNSKKNRYTQLKLEKRYAEAQLPDIEIVDMKKHNIKGRLISDRLDCEITKQKGKQTLLFLNRRGYAPVLLCRKCGFYFECKNCDSYLVVHDNYKKLQCHYCGEFNPYPDECPQCQMSEGIIVCGAGVEKLAEEVKNYYPELRQIILSSDYNHELEANLEAIKRNEVDIIIGTQLAAKGHHFPYITLVGVIEGDTGFNIGDPKHSERCHQILLQVTGRAGRGEHKGRALIQTWEPENEIIQSLTKSDQDNYYKSELNFRRKAALPPFRRLAAITISSQKQEQANLSAKLCNNELRLYARRNGNLEIYGPAPALLFRLRNKYRYKILLKTHKPKILQKAIRQMFDKTLRKHPTNTHIAIDIDPQNFY